MTVDQVKRFAKTFPTIRGMLLVLSLVVAIAAYVLLPIDALKWFIQYGAYWVAMGLITTFVCYFAFMWRAEKQERFAFSRWHYLALFAGLYILFIHADFGNKVTMDDYILSASATRLYEQQEYLVSTQGYWDEGEFKFATGYIDKRPWLYSSLVALLHFFTGWRLENAYVVNALLGALLLLLLARMGNREAGLKGTWLAVLAVASIPLVAQNATGGGMDLLNLTVLAGAVYFGGRYLVAPNRASEGLFFVTVLCLAYSRYESILYLAPAALVLCLGWLRARQVLLSWPTVFAPLLLLGYLLHNKLFRVSEVLWELPEGMARPFGLENLVSNFGSAVYFLFNTSDTLANSTLVSVFGVVALIFLIVVSVRALPELWRKHPQHFSVLLFGAGVLVNFLILLAYHDGELDRIFASRLALPFYLLLVLSIIYVLPRLVLKEVHWKCIFTVAAIYILGWSLPHNSRELFTKRNYVQNELDWLMRTIGPQVGTRDLVIDQKSTVWTLDRKTALRPYFFFENLPEIQRRLNGEFYTGIYFIERFEYEIEDGRIHLKEVNYPPASLSLETVVERSFRPFSMLRVSRVTAIHPEKITDEFRQRVGASGHVADYSFNGL